MSPAFDPASHPHRRFNPLTGRWMLVSPHRALRPWLGQAEPVAPQAVPAHDPGCYLCAGNTRASGERNPAYTGAWAFDNDFAALLPQAPGDAGGKGPALQAWPPEAPPPGEGLFQMQPVRGVSRVLCFSPDHGRSLPELGFDGVRAVVQAWCDESQALGRDWPWVQVFENKGAVMGCSNPHPHGQIWACDFLPEEPAAEDRCQRAWYASKGRPMLAELAEREADGPRVVLQHARWMAIVPFWAMWPFETLVLPRFAVARLPELASDDRDALARLVLELTARYDDLFGCSFPYSMGWHGAPFDDRPSQPWQLHAHFYPPLLRSATVRKFMVGFEMLAEPQRDLTPEQAAARLRAVPARPSGPHAAAGPA